MIPADLLRYLPPPPPDPLYKRAEAAEYVGLKPHTLAVWASNANTSGGAQPIPFLKRGRSVRYRKSDLDAYLAKCRVE